MTKLIKKFFGLLWLTRVPIVAVSLLLAMISLKFCNTYNFYFMISLACIIMAGYIQNDILDYEIDTISASSRPLPSGTISIHQAKILYKLLVILGLVGGLASRSILCLVYVCVVLAAFYVYTKYCKASWVLKNLFTAIISTTVVFAPVLCGGKINIKVVYLGTVAFFFTLGREILMDIRDREGDQIILNVKRPPSLLGHIIAFLFIFISFMIKELFFFETDIIRYMLYALIAFILSILFMEKKSVYWIMSESIKVIFIYDLIRIYIELR
ncbi:UbiA family prenyltransferase [Acetatifactor muris]|jgi:4-hydroxybenzoate polyprenyltransferase|uniref:Prenyltransferase n=1 Tax=Acetatifactor muris TaxID=879566 RepID=A0A2K4ZMB1_9FIRM|nr:UbiA family prenyltransferase [Acetatifactor muris]MCI8956313.1 UbiA family prenyltransferase [Eubacterium sp.]MCR2049858.1 UbiA family prenyltransferase [Acetatifactor muris]SOY31624.1 prenyltransferase [Acetatifactor muris]